MNPRVGPRTLVCGATLLVLSGCGSTIVGQRYNGPVFGRSQGASAALVLDPEPVAELIAIAGPGFEYGRLDHVYSRSEERPISAIDSWPTAPRPTLSSQRWLVFPRTTGTYIYFQDTPANRR